MDDLEQAMARAFPHIYTKANPIRSKFDAIAATCADGRPSLMQLMMNGMLPK